MKQSLWELLDGAELSEIDALIKATPPPPLPRRTLRAITAKAKKSIAASVCARPRRPILRAIMDTAAALLLVVGTAFGAWQLALLRQTPTAGAVGSPSDTTVTDPLLPTLHELLEPHELLSFLAFEDIVWGRGRSITTTDYPDLSDPMPGVSPEHLIMDLNRNGIYLSPELSETLTTAEPTSYLPLRFEYRIFGELRRHSITCTQTEGELEERMNAYLAACDKLVQLQLLSEFAEAYEEKFKGKADELDYFWSKVEQNIEAELLAAYCPDRTFLHEEIHEAYLQAFADRDDLAHAIRQALTDFKAAHPLPDLSALLMREYPIVTYQNTLTVFVRIDRFDEFLGDLHALYGQDLGIEDALFEGIRLFMVSKFELGYPNSFYPDITPEGTQSKTVDPDAPVTAPPETAIDTLTPDDDPIRWETTTTVPDPLPPDEQTPTDGHPSRDTSPPTSTAPYSPPDSTTSPHETFPEETQPS